METILRSRPGDFVVEVAAKEYDKMMFLAELAAPREIQMLADVEVRGNVLFVPKVYLIKQRVSLGTTEFDIPALANFLTVSKHPERIHGWIHCHVEMGRFWSDVDEANVARLVETMGWVVSIVYTLDGKMTARLDVKVDLKPSQTDSIELGSSVLTLDGIPCKVEDRLTKQEQAELRSLFSETVEIAGLDELMGDSQQRLLAGDIEEGCDEDIEIDDDIDEDDEDRNENEEDICSSCAREISNAVICQAGRDMFQAKALRQCDAWVPKE